MTTNYFAEIILPLSLNGTFTYHLSEIDLQQIKVGQRVSVPFGTQKLYTGIVYSIHQNAPELYKTKAIHAFLDDEPLVTQTQINFWEWMANYYMCSLGDVFRNAFPSALKLESQTFVRLINPNYETIEELNDYEFLVFEALKLREIISVEEAALIVDEKSAIPTLKLLIDKGIIRLDEKLNEKYTPKIDNYVRLHPDLKGNEAAFIEILNQLNKAPKQRETLLQLITLETQLQEKPLKVADFVKQGATNAVLKSLAEKGAVEIYKHQTSRVEEQEKDVTEISELTLKQTAALNQIKEDFKDKSTVLLHGVTSSGKTEIYLKLMEQVIAKGNKVLYLLPEISVTTQIVHRIKKHFGERVGVYHSKFNQNERVELWQKTLNGDFDIIIGPRTALYLPFDNLGMIIVDEEHESSYKQMDVKPFFHARDMAMLLGGMMNAKVLLGSATPSAESYYNAKNKKYGYVELTERFGNIKLPEINLVDLKKAQKEKEITEDISHTLRDEIFNQLHQKKQVILFQNRRGYAPVMECNTCGHTPECPNCDVSLTYHKFSNQLKCHYCGYAQAKPLRCPSCGSHELNTKGLGTEQIEQQVQTIFPDAKVRRMDVDSMRGKFAYEKLIEDFENKEIDILIGTQMITKGFDFGNVNFVGVIRADSLLNFPDFRAHEKVFQLLTQVSGRAGRRQEQGKVLIQSFQPEHQILQNVTTYSYASTMKDILYERKEFLYPPYSRLIKLRFKHKNKERLDKTAAQLVVLLKPSFDAKCLLGPEAPSIGRINNLYITDVMIKIRPNQSPQKVKDLIQSKIDQLHTIAAFRSVRIDVDVDPV
ncbi:replication restart helicase PriA [Empedobacter falsenii]|uniref:Replication restart protein PriA n=1 Tax=Empedobacter falsenii TaxID=343874 RepID=A0AAW7DC79_9FLAO|nr:primosomal protein N' [Empedobacter falsenii]MDM1549609.1 primosomal protein N' [Empedobacter falsenii]